MPYPPGGGTDMLARAIAEAMRPALGEPLVVDNRPGAATDIGADLVAKARLHDYTVMSADNALMAYNEHLFSRLPFDAEKDFSYTVKELLDEGRARPGQLDYASPGNGSP